MVVKYFTFLAAQYEVFYIFFIMTPLFTTYLYRVTDKQVNDW
ncbi:hypothetical protein GAB14E_0350 [Colwellia psychrerythraea]|uniref:Uncharacterized protein n=1 Tax=Colwellia psychrerythraea TaxID=28229 RepID=A0A099L3E8_COLPS|nr:hypothetical protein GAB14E_0350 [Colwellia psychrerythraea]